MVTYYVSSDCVAAVLEREEAVNQAAVRAAVSDCLALAGRRPWEEMEAERYGLENRFLLIARPRSPALRRLSGDFPRLRRKPDS